MMMSSCSAGSAFKSVTWIALTVIDEVVDVLLTICSLSTTVATPGIEIVVFAAGTEALSTPLTNAFTSVVDPVDPAAVEVQVLETVVAVARRAPTDTFATVEVLCALPPVPILPCVVTVRTPAVSTPSALMLASELVSGPPPVAGNVTVGVGPRLTRPVSLAPNALPLTDVTSTRALRECVAAGALPAKTVAARAVRIAAANPRPNRNLDSRCLQSSISKTPFLADRWVSSAS
jgi:hypothetical protein